jgi:hypothetical protein
MWCPGLAALASLAALLGGCFGGGAFTCSDSPQCGAGGTCQPNGLCSFPDAACASGQAYGEGSGPLSGVCVGDEPPDAATADADPDDPDAAPPVDAACEVDDLDVCALGADDGVIELGGEILDTDSDARCRDHAQGGGADEACLIYGSSITVVAGATTTVTGGRPLVLVAATTITIAGTLDAGSGDGHDGPSSNPAACLAFPTAPETDAGGGGGGAGGSFAATGGDGGEGDTNDSPPNTAAGGTHTAAVGVPAVIRGGCGGQRGGDQGGGGGGAGDGGDGGRGGGGVWLVARGAVVVEAGGAVSAAGAGGAGGEEHAGGGGGGAGGMIRIGAPTVTIAGTVAANGGGGGGGGVQFTRGGGMQVEISGEDGDDGEIGSGGGLGGTGATYMTTVLGGNGGAGGGIAVGGGVAGMASDVGAGGGGGGVGYVILRPGAEVTGTVSPAPTAPP